MFIRFVREVKTRVCGLKKDFKWEGIGLDIDYDIQDPANRERLLLDGWNKMSNLWVGVESEGNYTATVMSIVESVFECRFPQSRKLKILSVGAGPGLYEFFLASLLKKFGVNSRILSTDYSLNMIEFQNKVIDSGISIDGSEVSSLRGMILPMIADMVQMSKVHDDSIDILICNNSLQWVTDWKKAIVEIGRVMRHDGNKLAIFFIHPHGMNMCIGGSHKTQEHIALDALLEELHNSGFSPVKTRMMVGGAGSGQGGAPLNRMMVKTEYYPNGVEKHWRDLVRTPGEVRPFRTPK